MRVDAFDDFAVEIHHQAQDAVGCGMLRPEIHRNLAIVHVRRGVHLLTFGGVAFSSPGMM